MKVELNLPDKAFWLLDRKARSYGMTVQAMVTDFLLIGLRRIPDGGMDPVVSRWHKGMTDKQIARDLNMTNLAVSDRRRRFGLPANSLRVTANSRRVS